jgi:uncharacterized SAM-binding protein YcdF (DUF218 family)
MAAISSAHPIILLIFLLLLIIFLIVIVILIVLLLDPGVRASAPIGLNSATPKRARRAGVWELAKQGTALANAADRWKP